MAIVKTIAFSIAFGTAIVMAQTSTAPQRLPYAAVHNPQFITPAEATFMEAGDRVLGVITGDTPKAYPAGILAQHGLVEDDTPAGPIAVTW